MGFVSWLNGLQYRAFVKGFCTAMSVSYLTFKTKEAGLPESEYLRKTMHTRAYWVETEPWHFEYQRAFATFEIDETMSYPALLAEVLYAEIGWIFSLTPPAGRLRWYQEGMVIVKEYLQRHPELMEDA